jgi:hypothetical protein
VNTIPEREPEGAVLNHVADSGAAVGKFAELELHQ